MLSIELGYGPMGFGPWLDGGQEHMKQCCLQSLEGQHLLAQKSYLDLIHGSKTWVTGGLLYISSDEPKGNERMWGQKWRKIDDKVPGDQIFLA